MTTLNLPSSPLAPAPVAPPEFTQLTARLNAIGNRFRLALFLHAAARLLAILIPLTLITLFAAGYFSLPSSANITLLVAWLIIALASAALLLRPIFQRPTYAQIARLIEQNAHSNTPIHNALINSVLLAQDLEAGDKNPWLPHALRQLSSLAAPLPLEKSVPWNKSRNASLITLALLLIAILLTALAPNTFAHGLSVLLSPNHFVPKTGNVKITSVLPGNDTALAGQSLSFAVTVDSPDHKTIDAQLHLHFASGKTQNLPMLPFGSENSQYTRQGILAAEDIDYTITAGDSESDRFHITVQPQIHLTDFTLEATPPAYTVAKTQTLHLPAKLATTASQPQRPALEAPIGSAINLSITLDAPAKELLLDIPGKSPTALLTRDNRTFSTSFPLLDSFTFTLRANDATGRTLRQFPDDPNINAYSLTALPDNPPTITITQPARNIELKPDAKLTLIAQAADDYGLSNVNFEVLDSRDNKFYSTNGTTIGGRTAPTRTFTKRVDLDFSQLTPPKKPGDVLTYRFTATDNRDLTSLDPNLTHQKTTSQSFTITFSNNPDNINNLANSTKLWEELRQKLSAILDHQIALRKQAGNITPDLSIADAQKMTTPISDGQKSIRADITSLAKDFPFEPSMKLVQKTLEVLAVEDATTAVDRAADILLLTDNRSLTPLATGLRQHQSRIIDVLQALLAIIAADQQKLARTADHEGGDIPNPTEAWRKLADDLKDFIKDQKAVIDATADLAKKPKDEFNPADEKKLTDLAAVEDKWERFLNDRLADMSKLAEQDQANASLLEEVVQMKIELATAENALNTKATQIAVPVEGSGLEDAQQLTTHIERFLSQAPDRKQWQMEDSLSQNDPVMAQLPKELQDMEGDLMDKEEDLTQDMESLASKFADSIDKGAGWDAADGPISNMSAQGVTGNQMPKDMEIQGRSGEGREGRASGEMVGSTASGKEGRQTPTRLTPDPFSNSQVDDKSTLPEGGATGGGKKGNLGTQGLEGPAPQDDPNITQRLAGQQAAIRNEAERLALQMHSAQYDNFKLVESNAYLKKSEDALKQFHYQTALYYQEKAVQSLNTAKVLATGEVHVIADTTPGASEKIQKEIDAALNGPLPKGYADPVKAYFEKLSNTK